ncbi:hypothetical protein Tco_0025144 [Tanacetum coccineum]
MDSNPSQPLVSTPVDTRMNIEDQQATGGPPSLGVISEARANPQLSSAASIAEADPGIFAPSDFVPQQQGMNEGTINTSYDHLFAGKGANSVASQIEEETSSIIKLEDLIKLVSHVQPSFKYLDLPKYDLVIVMNNSDEDKDDEVYATENVETGDTLVPKSASPSSLPIELKDLPSKFNDLTEEVKGLKNQVHNLEIELPGELKEIPPKLEDFTKTVASLTSQAKLKTLDALPSLLNNVTNALNQFAQAITLNKTVEEAVKESTKSDSDDDETHLSGSMVESSWIKKKIEVRKEELIDILGPKVVNKYYNDKLQYDRYCDKMLNRRAVSKITNCDVLTRKGPIILKVYREDGTSEIIPNFKASDLHLGEWREVMKACPNRTGKGWETIYKQIGIRMDYIHTTKAELGINLDIPLSKQDPLGKLNDLANKKRKHADDIHDYF